MLIPTLPTQPLKRLIQIKQILPILAARAFALQYPARQLIRILRTQELRVGR